MLAPDECCLATTSIAQATQANGVTASTIYDAGDRVLNLSNIAADLTLVSGFTYTYDNLNNRTSVVELDGSQVNWGYDKTYQLTSEVRNGTLGWADLTLDNWSQMTLEQWQTMDLDSTGVNYATTYTYDGAGNRLLRNDAASGLTAYSYDPANQLLTTLESAGTTTYSYDGAGNRTKRVEPTTGATTYTWDYQNRLIGLSDPATGVATNVYNAVGQRMETENTSGTTMFVFDMQNLLLETDGSGNTQVYYTLSTTMAGQFGDLISERFPRATPHAYTEFYAFDALGSTGSLVDEGGAVDDKYVYTAFGILANAPQTTENRHTYVGKFGYQDDFGSGVYYVRARWYEADTGRWLSDDPIRFLAGTNHCLYVRNDPTTFVDPSGLVLLMPCAEAKLLIKNMEATTWMRGVNFQSDDAKPLTSIWRVPQTTNTLNLTGTTDSQIFGAMLSRGRTIFHRTEASVVHEIAVRHAIVQAYRDSDFTFGITGYAKFDDWYFTLSNPYDLDSAHVILGGMTPYEALKGAASSGRTQIGCRCAIIEPDFDNGN